MFRKRLLFNDVLPRGLATQENTPDTERNMAQGSLLTYKITSGHTTRDHVGMANVFNVRLEHRGYIRQEKPHLVRHPFSGECNPCRCGSRVLL